MIFRDHVLGTWYIQSLCKVLMTHAHENHIIQMLEKASVELETNHRGKGSELQKSEHQKSIKASERQQSIKASERQQSIKASELRQLPMAYQLWIPRPVGGEVSVS
jgi:hypothetical protein